AADDAQRRLPAPHRRDDRRRRGERAMTAITIPITRTKAPALAHPSNAHGFAVLVARRIRVTTKTASGIIAQLVTPILWVLVVAPALASSRGAFNPHVDYFTFLAVGQVAFLIPFTAMFN